MDNGGVRDKRYVRPAMLYGSEAWCLKESQMGILQRTEIHVESNMWSASQGEKRPKNFRSMLGFNETINQLAMVNSVHLHGNVLRREDRHVLRRALDFVAEDHKKKWRLMRIQKKQVEEESMMVGLRMKDTLC